MTFIFSEIHFLFNISPPAPLYNHLFANLNQIRASIHISDVRRPNETNPINAAEKKRTRF